MLQAIAQARKSITFETYIYWSGQIGRKFTDALSKKAKEGVKVECFVRLGGKRKMDRDVERNGRCRNSDGPISQSVLVYGIKNSTIVPIGR